MGNKANKGNNSSKESSKSKKTLEEEDEYFDDNMPKFRVKKCMIH